MFEPQARLLSAAPFDHEPAQRFVDGSADHAADDASDVGGGTATTSGSSSASTSETSPRVRVDRLFIRIPGAIHVPPPAVAAVVHLMAPVPIFPREAAVEGTVAERMYRRRWSADKPLILMASPERFERPTLRFVGCGSRAHTKLPNRQNKRGEWQGTRPATALPTVRFLLSCTPELEAASKSLLVDTIGNIEIGAVRMTRYAPMTPKQLKLRRCKLPGKQRHLAKRVHTGHPVQMPTHAARS
jgi:hypothetical protein